MGHSPVKTPENPPAPAVIERSRLPALFGALKARGFQLAGPTVRDGAIIYDEINEVADLPAGWTEVQEAGTYRLQRRGDNALFGYTVGPHSWKKYLFPPATRLWSAKRTGAAFEIESGTKTEPKRALIGVRSCDLHAIAIQDRVFLGSGFVDPTYARRREKLFIVALQCAVAGGTCFCVSMKTGPRAERGFDLALTEIIEGERHYFARLAPSCCKP